jgi:Golgi phosphoprotein 3
MLFIYEELLLLAIDNDKSTVLPSVRKRLGFGLAGAVLAELALQGRLQVNEKRRLEVSNEAVTGDKYLDKLLKKIQDLEKPRKVTFWIQMLNDKPKKLRNEIFDHLVAKGYALPEDDGSEEDESASDTAPAVKPTKYEIKRRLRASVLGGEAVDQHSLAVLSLARASKLLSLVFTKDERVVAQRRIHEAMVRSALENATAQTLEVIEASVASCLADSMR